jgi:hypothetical protein
MTLTAVFSRFLASRIIAKKCVYSSGLPRAENGRSNYGAFQGFEIDSRIEVLSRPSCASNQSFFCELGFRIIRANRLAWPADHGLL